MIPPSAMPDPEITKSCPTCGAPITREDLSLCSYCGSPVQLGGAQATAEGEESPNTERLIRMQEKEEWAPAMDWDPLPASRNAGARAVALSLIGSSLAALPVALILHYIAGLIVGAIVFMALLTKLNREDPLAPTNPDAPLSKRAAVVLDRRSETEIEKGEGRTTYYFTLEFADTARGEFRFPGRGASFDLMTVGATGVAYTRGADLLAFKKIRV